MSVVSSDQNILNGALVFKSTRVPVRNLFDYLRAGDSVKEFLEDFPTVSSEQVRHVLQNTESISSDDHNSTPLSISWADFFAAEGAAPEEFMDFKNHKQPPIHQ